MPGFLVEAVVLRKILLGQVEPDGVDFPGYDLGLVVHSLHVDRGYRQHDLLVLRGDLARRVGVEGEGGYHALPSGGGGDGVLDAPFPDEVDAGGRAVGRDDFDRVVEEVAGLEGPDDGRGHILVEDEEHGEFRAGLDEVLRLVDVDVRVVLAVADRDYLVLAEPGNLGLEGRAEHLDGYVLEQTHDHGDVLAGVVLRDVAGDVLAHGSPIEVDAADDV